MKILEMLGYGTIGVTATGATANDVCELSNNLVQLGHDVTVADVKSDRERKLLDSRVKVCEADVPSPLDTEIGSKFLDKVALKALSYTSFARQYRYLRKLSLHYRFTRAVTAKLRLEEFDVIHTHHAQQAVWLLKLYRRPYIHTNHWEYSPDDRSLDARIERAVLRGARAAVGLGGYLRAFEPSANHAVIRNGIDTKKWKPLGRQESRDALRIPHEDFVLVFVGGVEYRKGADVLVEAVQHLTLEKRRFSVYIIGALSRQKYSSDLSRHSHDIDDYARRLMEQVKDRPIYFLGFMDNMSVEFRRYLSAADLFVLPSRSDAQPLAVLEALAMGLPVVVSDVGGLSEMVNDEIGYTFPAGHADQLARIVCRLGSDPNHLANLRENCRKYVERHYSWESVALRYADLFERCMTTSNAGR